MWHLKKRRKLSRPSSHRNALVINLCKSLIKHGRIRTTKTKAKMARPVIEKLITRAKDNTLHNKRIAASHLRSWELIPELFDIAQKFKARSGGYTRIIKLGFRNSDGSEMVILEFLEEFSIGRKIETDESEESSKDKIKTDIKKKKELKKK